MSRRKRSSSSQGIPLPCVPGTGYPCGCSRGSLCGLWPDHTPESPSPCLSHLQRSQVSPVRAASARLHPVLSILPSSSGVPERPFLNSRPGQPHGALWQRSLLWAVRSVILRYFFGVTGSLSPTVGCELRSGLLTVLPPLPERVQLGQAGALCGLRGTRVSRLLLSGFSARVSDHRVASRSPQLDLKIRLPPHFTLMTALTLGVA